mmetsp:Transcript_78871/g.209444  ORF Transcript_78871/g.209444 Transcript_78871/m.209444 type:complete len:204 (-) Transcript_78871:570-1181(-)
MSATSSSCMVWASAVATACRMGDASLRDQALTRRRVLRSIMLSLMDASQGLRSTPPASGRASGSQQSILRSRSCRGRPAPALLTSCTRCLGSFMLRFSGRALRPRQPPRELGTCSKHPLGNGCLPVMSMNRMIPADQMSHLRPYSRPLFTSGAMYASVPALPRSHFSSTPPVLWAIATPKSMTLTVGLSASPVRRQFGHLRSR